METQQRILCRRELPFGHQPTLITKREAGHLIRQLQLQLLASLSQGRAELKKMPLYQAGGCGDAQNDPLARTDRSLAQGAWFLLLMC
ncbi:hypothetical protein MITS9508_02083 [Synechococcus sp. MIT S9508]|nr:hypothetical protein MITS9508_02083 [Synechococcus sp. MIT S9508]